MPTIPDPSVTAIAEHITHHAELIDATGKKTGLMFVNARGEFDPLAMRRAPFSRTGLKISQGSTKYDDSQLPYRTDTQDNWSAGRASEYLDDDVNRYNDGFRAHSEFDKRVFAGPMETYGYCDHALYGTPVHENWDNVAVYEDLFGGGLATDVEIATRITTLASPVAGWTPGYLYLYLKPHVAASGTLEAYLYTDVAGSPGANLGRIGIVPAVSFPSATQFNKNNFFEYCMKAENAIALSPSTNYWIVLKITGAVSTNAWWYGYYGTANSKRITSGVWTATNAKCFNYRLVGDAAFNQGKFFEYRGAMYCVNNYGAYPALFINGDRGVADASASLTLLDATKTWVVNRWAGATVLIVKGPAARQDKAYRTILTNTANTLTLEGPAWDVIPTTTDEYVIVGTKYWSLLSLIAYPGPTRCTDVAVAGSFVYMAFGTSSYVVRYRCYNNAGVHTEQEDLESIYADKLIAIYDSGEKAYYLWCADNFSTGFAAVAEFKRMRVPTAWGDLYHKVGYLTPPTTAWDTYLDVYQAIADSYATPNFVRLRCNAATSGLVWFKNLQSPVDVFANGGTGIGCLISTGGVALNAGDIKLWLSDEENVGNGKPVVVTFDATNYRQYFNGVDRCDDASHYYNSYIGGFGPTVRLYIGAPKRFNKIKVRLGPLLNTNSSVLTATIFNRGTWVAQVITDGTIDPAGKTLGKSGDITFTLPTDWEPGIDEVIQEVAWATAGALNDAPTNYYYICLAFSAVTTSVSLAEISVEYADIRKYDFPALISGMYNWAIIDLTEGQLNLRSIKSVGIMLNSSMDLDLIIWDGIQVISGNEEFIPAGLNTPIKKLAAYGDDRANPWMLTWDSINEDQTENANVVVKVPLEEISELSSPSNALDAVTNDVYLYFNMGQRLERYHAQTLEDIGPNKELGLPLYRQGDIVSLASLPGGIYAVVNSYISSILQRKGSGWHELYRSPTRYKVLGGLATLDQFPIADITAQAIPGGYVKLWIAQGNELLSINLMFAPNEQHGHYLHESTVTTAWITMGFLDVEKVFMRLKLYTEGMAGTQDKRIKVYYQLENDTGAWTLLSYLSNLVDNDIYCVSPFETKEFAVGVRGRRIRFMFVLTSDGRSEPPILRSYVLDALLRLPVYNIYTLPVLLSDKSVDINGNPDPSQRAETLLATLDGYAGAPPTVLTLRTLFSTADNKRVIIEPFPLRPKEITVQPGGINSFEAHLIEINLLEV